MPTDAYTPFGANDPMYAALRTACTAPLTIVGVGNALRGDDGFGPTVIAALPERHGITCFDTGMAPENWLGPIARSCPATVLVLDATDLAEPPGTLRLLRGDELGSIGVSTHGLPLGFFLGLVEERTGVPAVLLAAQPVCVDLGAPMSDAMQAAATRACSAIRTVAESLATCKR